MTYSEIKSIKYKKIPKTNLYENESLEKLDSTLHLSKSTEIDVNYTDNKKVEIPGHKIISVYDVADYILKQVGYITTMKLQKLVYYCQAWSLVWDEPTCEMLKHEKYLFLTKCAPYNLEDAFCLLVSRVENLISKENTQWSEYSEQTKNIEK
ncbi:MAG: hypothetical protein H8E98_01335 [Bacteroidetes bacterium]|nr:hypothetical protein [Bacteroidota bacterium]